VAKKLTNIHTCFFTRFLCSLHSFQFERNSETAPPFISHCIAQKQKLMRALWCSCLKQPHTLIVIDPATKQDPTFNLLFALECPGL
jgi:hypothetical protein